jgi:hypothetical protein
MHYTLLDKQISCSWLPAACHLVDRTEDVLNLIALGSWVEVEDGFFGYYAGQLADP